MINGFPYSKQVQASRAVNSVTDVGSKNARERKPPLLKQGFHLQTHGPCGKDVKKIREYFGTPFFN